MIQKSITKQIGLTLIEIMVAMTIGLIIMAGVMQIYVSNKQTYRVTEAMSRLQENGRFASHFIMKDIRSAGYQGCKKRLYMDTKLAVSPPDYIYDPNASLSAINNSDGSETIGTTAISPLPNTDVLTVQSAQRCGVLDAAMTSTSSNISVSLSCTIKNNDYFIVSDCGSSELAQVTNSDPVTSPISHTAFISKYYNAGTDFLKVSSFTYFIGINASGIPALMRRDNNAGTIEEMVEDVEDLQFEYGEDTNGDDVPNRYVTANNVVNMQDVVSVKMTISVRTASNGMALSASTNPTTGATDKRIRKTFSTTIAIRNN